MIDLESAGRIVLQEAFTPGTEYVYLTEAAGRILAEDITSDVDMPPFDKATVDGFACRRSDLGRPLRIISTIAAGQRSEVAGGEGSCFRIMTGAPVPDGCDMVFMKEDSELADADHVLCLSPASKDNIAYRSEDVRKGDLVLRMGRLILAQDISVMASVGKTAIRVGKRPRVSVLSTGDELVEPHRMPGPAEIRNSNASQLMVQVSRAGGLPHYCGIASDDEDETLSMVQDALKSSDILLITGGVSMGDFDFVPLIMEKTGIRILFSRVNVQPGKPTTFGVHPSCLVFGLPGNPVSAFIQFELLVRPLIAAMMGGSWKALTFRAKLLNDYTRRSAERLQMVPVRVMPGGFVDPVPYHGSAHISALRTADALISIAPGCKTLPAGTEIDVRQL